MDVVCKEIHGSHGVDTFEQAVNQFVVATYRDALILVVEVIVVEDESYWQALDDEGRQVGTLTPPLLLGITFDESLVDIFTDEYLCLFLQAYSSEFSLSFTG